MAKTDSNQHSVLIPTGFDPIACLCARSLSRRGIHTIIASEHADLPAYHSRYCDETIVLPSPDDDLLAYKDGLIGVAARSDVRTIIPIRPQDPYLFSKYRDEFENYVTLVTPPFETLGRVHDRLRLAEAAEKAGVPVPETRSLDEVDDWTPALIIKSRYNLLAAEYVDSYSPNEFDVIKTIKHLQPGETPDVDAIRDEMKHVPIVQEYVPTAGEYVFGALYDHGEPLTTFQHRQIRGDSYTGGGGVYRETVDIPELEEVGRTLLESLDWHGVACIEYMEDANTGEFKLTEINPRMWQSLPCAVHAGADFPYDYWLQAMGRQDMIEPGYEVGVGTHFLYGEFQHLRSILQEDSPLVEKPSFPGRLWEILYSCYEMPQFDYLRLDDPLPFAYNIYHVIKERV